MEDTKFKYLKITFENGFEMEFRNVEASTLSMGDKKCMYIVDLVNKKHGWYVKDNVPMIAIEMELMEDEPTAETESSQE